MSLSGLSPFDRKGHQRRLIVSALRRVRTASRVELAAETGLSRQIVTLLVEELLGDGMLHELGRRASARGQPPIELALNPEGGFAIGLQIERGRITGLIADLEARIRVQESLSCPTNAPMLALPAIKGLVERLIATARVDRSRLWGAGVVLPGPFGVVPDPADLLSMPGWSQQDFVPDYAAALGVPVIVGNDATAAALAAHLDGAARDLHDFVYLYLGEGVGGGLFADGRPLTGAFGNAGEIGRMMLPLETGAATLESVASISALRSLLMAAGQHDIALAEPGALLALAPEVTERWYNDAAAALRLALVNIENMLDPDAILLGGPLPLAALKTLMTKMQPLPPSVSQRGDRLHARLLIGDSTRTSPALGAATLPLFRALTPQPRTARLSRRRKLSQAIGLGPELLQ